MDPANISWLEANPDDSYWKPIIDEVILKDIGSEISAVSEMFDGNENAWDDLRRRERVAEAMYE